MPTMTEMSAIALWKNLKVRTRFLSDQLMIITKCCTQQLFRQCARSCWLRVGSVHLEYFYQSKIMIINTSKQQRVCARESSHFINHRGVYSTVIIWILWSQSAVKHLQFSAQIAAAIEEKCDRCSRGKGHAEWQHEKEGLWGIWISFWTIQSSSCSNHCLAASTIGWEEQPEVWRKSRSRLWLPLNETWSFRDHLKS